MDHYHYYYLVYHITLLCFKLKQKKEKSKWTQSEFMRPSELKQKKGEK